MRTQGLVRNLLLLAALLTGGCTSESLRTALEAQRRADQVNGAVFDRQQDALRVLLFRDLVARLERADGPLTPAEIEALNRAWNERDLIAFWGVQHERAAALRLAGVDAKLWADQSIVDLMIKQVEAKLDRGVEAAAEVRGKSAFGRADAGAEGANNE